MSQTAGKGDTDSGCGRSMLETKTAYLPQVYDHSHPGHEGRNLSTHTPLIIVGHTELARWFPQMRPNAFSFSPICFMTSSRRSTVMLTQSLSLHQEFILSFAIPAILANTSSSCHHPLRKKAKGLSSEMAQRVTRRSREHKELSSIPRTHTSKPDTVVHTHSSSPGVTKIGRCLWQPKQQVPGQ